MTDQMQYTVKLGYVSIKSWIQINRLPNGSYELIGMGSKTEYDQHGQITAFNVSQTGLTGCAPHNAFGERRSFRQRFYGFIEKIMRLA